MIIISIKGYYFFLERNMLKIAYDRDILLYEIGLKKTKPIVSKRTKDREYPKILFFVLHWVLCFITATTFMHIQVITRFMCSHCICLYWYIALNWNSTRFKKYITIYFLFFNLIGTTLFINFYPWT